MALRWPSKDPDEVLDYTLTWAKRLPAGDLISSSQWFLPDGITANRLTNDDTTTGLWLEGGEVGQTYTFLNRIVTRDSRVMDQSVTIKIKEK